MSRASKGARVVGGNLDALRIAHVTRLRGIYEELFAEYERMTAALSQQVYTIRHDYAQSGAQVRARIDRAARAFETLCSSAAKLATTADALRGHGIEVDAFGEVFDASDFEGLRLSLGLRRS
jgi:hypothetical protein